MITRLLLATFVSVLALTAPLFAHDDYRIIGTVLVVTQSKLDVKQKDGKTVSIKTSEATLVTRDKKKVPRTEVKAGGSVVVDARGDDLADLTAVEIKLVPPPKAP